MKNPGTYLPLASIAFLIAATVFVARISTICLPIATALALSATVAIRFRLNTLATPLAETVRAGQSVATPVPSAPIARHAPAAAPVAAPRQQERIANPEEREIRLVFDEESWVEVRDRSNTVIYSQLKAAGTTGRVSGLPPLAVVVGNAHGVRMTYAGQQIDLGRHTKIDVARLTLE